MRSTKFLKDKYEENRKLVRTSAYILVAVILVIGIGMVVANLVLNLGSNLEQDRNYKQQPNDQGFNRTLERNATIQVTDQNFTESSEDVRRIAGTNGDYVVDDSTEKIGNWEAGRVPIEIPG